MTTGKQSTRSRGVLVGFDGSDRGIDALYLARAIAQAEESELLVACVYEPESIFDGGDRYLPPVDEKKARARREAEMRRRFSMVEAELGSKQYDRHELWGSPARQLTLLAEDADVDVVVVGSTHQGALGRVLPGSVGEKLLHGAPCAVAVAPLGFAETNHFGDAPIGVGYTGSEESKLALAWAERLARSLGSKLHLIEAIPRLPPPYRAGPAGTPDYGTRIRNDAEETVAAAANGIPDIHVESVVVDGEPAEVLVGESAKLNLIAVGSRGYGPLRRVLLGGVSNRLIRSAACPVVVTPHASASRLTEIEMSSGTAVQVPPA